MYAYIRIHISYTTIYLQYIACFKVTISEELNQLISINRRSKALELFDEMARRKLQRNVPWRIDSVGRKWLNKAMVTEQ